MNDNSNDYGCIVTMKSSPAEKIRLMSSMFYVLGGEMFLRGGRRVRMVGAVMRHIVRDVLSFIIAITMERNPSMGFDSYDRIFPCQNRLPKGGFGNLIALPLQGAPRKAGNSLFVDECHGVPAISFEAVTNAFTGRYILGLSATPVRRDGMHPIIQMQCGPLRHRVEPAAMTTFEHFDHRVNVRLTGFESAFCSKEEGEKPSYSLLIEELIINVRTNVQ